MMSQIQPHFLFNTLSTIQALAETDAEKASKVIEEFAMYLRQNIDSLNQESLISVKKEIEHTRIYSDIERVRFPSLKIDYEIEDVDYLIPPLTIQPLVENAIRHGVRGKKNGRAFGCDRELSRRIHEFLFLGGVLRKEFLHRNKESCT